MIKIINISNITKLIFSYQLFQQKCFMENEGDALQAISIGFVVACFLLNTSRVLKAIELCKECLFILKTKEVTKDEKLVKKFYKAIYLKIMKAHCLISDYTNGIEYAEKVLYMFRECGDRLEECKLNSTLVTMYLRQSKYVEAKELCEKALVTSKEIGDKNA